jgi:YHS domain-containing protein
MTGRIRLSVSAIGSLAISLVAACGASRVVEKSGPSASGVGVAPVYRFPGALALNGYDAVAYFTDEKAAEGSDRWTHEWNGAKWHFASAANRDLFASRPEEYAPQYGGYCAWAVSHGYTAKGDPKAWKIVDGRLYLNYDQDVRAKWEQDVPGYVAKGNANWQRFLKEKPDHKGE